MTLVPCSDSPVYASPCFPCRWFHGKITRVQAEVLLKPPEDGLFLIRESSNYPGDYTLCVCCGNKVEHYRILYRNNRLTVDEEGYFRNLAELVQVAEQIEKLRTKLDEL